MESSSFPKKNPKIESTTLNFEKNPKIDPQSLESFGDFHCACCSRIAVGSLGRKRRAPQIDIREEARRYRARVQPLPNISTTEELWMALREMRVHAAEEERQQRLNSETSSESALEMMRILLPAYFTLVRSRIGSCIAAAIMGLAGLLGYEN